MSYILGSITLPNPTEFVRETIETSRQNILLSGETKKDITNRKERYVLRFQYLTPSEVNSILSEYNLETTRNFEVTETNLTINSTPVHIEMQRREYASGGEYRENLTLILTEVI